jgi:hypothetical protein
VAVTVTVVAEVMVAGAVYRPLLLIDPAPVAGLMLQVTVALLVFATVVENCCVPPP